MRHIIIDPHDTLFFRDGRPFNGDDEGAASAFSLFPPSPRTTAMMMRAALAQRQGWTGGDWRTWDKKPDNFVEILGQEPSKLGAFKCKAPQILYQDKPLFPVPFSLVGKWDKTQVDSPVTDVLWLRRGKQQKCDMGDAVALPSLPTLSKEDAGGWKTFEDYFLTQKGMEAYLQGQCPPTTEFILQDRLFEKEMRIGIGRNHKTRMTIKGQLYVTSQVRFQSNIALGTGIEFEDKTINLTDWPINGSQPFGGEGRFVWLEERQQTADKPFPTQRWSEKDGKIHYTVTLVSPMNPTANNWQKSGGCLDEHLPGKIITACIGKPVHFGGWDGVNSRPLALKPYLPSGCVWFMEADNDDFKGKEAELPSSLGQETEFGFGECIYGQWPEQGEIS